MVEQYIGVFMLKEDLLLQLLTCVTDTVQVSVTVFDTGRAKVSVMDKDMREMKVENLIPHKEGSC